MIHYHSLFRHGVDEKRRVQVPAKWRPSQADVEFTLILWPNGAQPDACLLVLPPAEMNALAEKIRAMSFADPKASALRRLLGSKSANVSLDKGGRICLPETMAKAVGIENEAILVGLVDRFEIWNPEQYQRVSAVDEALLPEAFKLI
ncbi:MAG TPA: transcriptional regulator MraZ [Verrucomicrobiae bacterium]|nr:transcriptional regulator MraZ [Verrucomicrobiae bacterium]